MSDAFDVHIVATGGHLPGDPIDNDQVARLSGGLPDDILKGLQVRRRHWMIDPVSGAHLSSTSEMATQAARIALDRAQLESTDIDLLVMSTASPEYHLPAAVTFVQEKLGLSRCAVFEVRSGCAGFVQALDLARLQLAGGRYRTALVLGAESISPLLVPMFHSRDPETVRLRDRLSVYNFGDGAGAVVLRAEPSQGDPRAGIYASVNACMGGDRKVGMQVIGGGTDVPVAEQQRRRRLMNLRVDVVESAAYGPKVFVDALADLFDRSGLTLDQLDVAVVPEGNAGYFSSELEAAGMSPEYWKQLQGKVVENLTDVGATGSAAVPLALDAGWQEGLIVPGGQVFLLAIETSRWIYAGNALTWNAPVRGDARG